MQGPYQLLALKNGFGSVFRCDNGCLHVSVGRVAIAMNVEEYYELVDMINTSAANFELHRPPAAEAGDDLRPASG